MFSPRDRMYKQVTVATKVPLGVSENIIQPIQYTKAPIINTNNSSMYLRESASNNFEPSPP